MASSKPKIHYHIETKDGGSTCHFFTRATDNKEALKNLQKNSIDFNNVVDSEKDLTITIKKLI
jgi:hypothetical protein